MFLAAFCRQINKYNAVSDTQEKDRNYQAEILRKNKKNHFPGRIIITAYLLVLGRYIRNRMIFKILNLILQEASPNGHT